jgi:hypothetical protein
MRTKPARPGPILRAARVAFVDPAAHGWCAAADEHRDLGDGQQLLTLVQDPPGGMAQPELFVRTA